MRTLKLTLSYDGTDYSGWQSQVGVRTLQDTFEAALAKVTGESLRVTASGRTDAGVHALGQVISFPTRSTLSMGDLQRALNAELPRDICVLCIEEVAADFHAIRSAQRKRYRYQIQDGPLRDVFLLRYAWHVWRRLDDAAMHRAAQALVGTHDFCAFQSSGAERENTVRTVFDCSVRRGRGGERGRERGEQENMEQAERSPLIHVDIEANGFLYNMVRTIVGTLFQVGRGERPETWPGEVLRSLDRRQAGQTAPAEGLVLLEVNY